MPEEKKETIAARKSKESAASGGKAASGPSLKWAWRGAIALGLILLIAAAFNLTVRLNFLIGDEIIINLSPEQDSLSLHYGEQKKEGINFSVETHPYCTAFCAYTFGDKSRNIILDRGNLTLRAGEQIFREYTLSPSRVGRGQDVYLFDVSCHNLRSVICLANKKVKYRSSLIILNYDLSEQEKAFKEESSAILLPLLSRLAELDSALKAQSERIISLASIVRMEDFQEQKAALEGKFSSLLLIVERFRTLWSSEAYAELRAQLNSPINESITALGQNLAFLSQQIDGRVLRYNGLMLRLKELASESNHAQDLYSLAQSANNSHLKAGIGDFGKRINATFALLKHPEFGDYPAIEQSTSEIDALSENLTHDSRALRSEEQVRLRLSLGQEKDYLCILERNWTACSVDETIRSLNDDYLSEKEHQWYETSIAQDACESVQGLESAYAAARNRTAREIALRNITFDDNAGNGEWNAAALNFSDSLKSNILFEYAKELSNAGNSELLAAAIKILGFPASSIGMEENNKTELKKLYLLTRIGIGNKTKEYVNILCSSPEKYLFQFNKEEFVAINISVPYPGASSIDTSLLQNPAVCCVFGECNECCTLSSCASQEETFPVIFLHGHAFTQGSSPAYSLDAFTLIQYALEEEGYLNAGIVTPTTAPDEAVAGEWGLSGKPVSIRASYYLDAYLEGKKYVIVPTKTESIDTYALRLRDVIAVVKERTGKQKVNIVAHSMGGLVARRYIQIFGDESVNKLIMLATPNYGVEGRASDFCPLFGEQKECQDMQHDSLFLNRLNDPSRQPDNVKLYTIAGVGCDTGRKDGDGLVSAESAHLPKAVQFNISGNCGGFLSEPLHTKMLDINMYPKTIGAIKAALKDNNKNNASLAMPKEDKWYQTTILGKILENSSLFTQKSP